MNRPSFQTGTPLDLVVDALLAASEALLASLPQWLALGVALALACALGALGLHLGAARAVARRRRRHARWEPLLLDVLAGDAPPGALEQDVAPGETTDFLQMLVRYALRVDGEARETLAAVAAPFLPASRALLRSHRADRRALGVHLLGILGHRGYRPLLVEALRDRSPGVAMGAARALARTADLSVLPDLVASLDRFTTWGTPAVTSMLARFGLRAGHLLALRLADPGAPESVRVACAETLRRLGYVPADAVVDALLHPGAATPREVRTALLRLVAEIGTSGMAPLVRRHVTDPDPVVRLHALSALGALGDPFRDAELLLDTLDDPDSWAALRAAHALARLGRRDLLRRAAATDDTRGRLARQTLAAA